MKNRKRRLEAFSLYDHTGIERHLERMVKRGWLLEKISSFGWIYRAIEPQSLKFTVTYYPAASEFDPEPSEKQQTYWDFCRQDGWKLAAASAQMQVFYSEQEKPYPIDTDPLLQLQSVRKTMKKGYLPVYLILLLLGVMQAVIFWGNLWMDPARILSSSTSLYNGVAFTLLILLSAAEIGGYFCWYRKAKAAAKLTGSFLETRGHSRLQKVILLLFAAAFLLWILSLAGELEMWVALFGIVTMAFYNLCRDGILREFTGDQNASLLGYHVVEEDASLWSANQVYQYYSDGFPMSRYLLCYDSHLVEISFNWEPTQEQIAQAGSILGQVSEA